MIPKRDYNKAFTWLVIGLITVVFWYKIIRFFI